MQKQNKHPYYKHSLIISKLFYTAWLAFFLFIADFPPPRGFWVVPVILLILAIILNHSTRPFLQNNHIPSWKSFFKNIFYWALAGIIIGTIIGFLPSGEPSIPPATALDHLYGIIFITSFTIGNGFIYYAACWLIHKPSIKKCLKIG